MNREERIEEMAKTLCEDCAKSDPCSLAAVGEMCNVVREQATAMYTAGYRKQEWISVEERLPNIDPYGKGRYGGQRSVRVLCSCKQKKTAEPSSRKDIMSHVVMGLCIGESPEVLILSPIGCHFLNRRKIHKNGFSVFMDRFLKDFCEKPHIKTKKSFL